MADSITISRKEYERLKAVNASAEEHAEIQRGPEENLADIKAGSIIRYR